MAIRIPSKNIYGSPQNPKVRDNVIERIEVGAVEVVPDNDYEAAIYNESINNINNTEKATNNNFHSKILTQNVSSYDAYYGISLSGISLTRIYYRGSITIDRTTNNKYITKLLYGKNEKNEEQIKFYVKCKKEIGSCSTNGSYTYLVEGNYENISVSNVFFNFNNIKRTTESTLVGQTLPNDEYGNLLKTYSYTEESEYGQDLDLPISSTAKISFTDETYFTLTSQSDEHFTFDFYILCGIIKDGIGYSVNGSYVREDTPEEPIQNRIIENANGRFEAYLPEQIEITIYGNTIGIDLKDKTVYVPSTDKTSKKVFRVEGNELMQTTNYIAEPSRNALQEDFGKTKKQYAKGKETATIRCSISDYYDYNSGNKVIAVDNSTKKMSFDESDQVIPMVYGADGQDHPMSLNKDGTPKVFSVLGTKKYYNGAVWQELYLQET